MSTASTITITISAPRAPLEIAELGRRLKSVNDELKQLEDAWLDLSAWLDAVGA